MDVSYADAQVGVLGSLLCFPAECSRPIMMQVRAEYFSNPTYRRIFEAAQSVFTAGGEIDPVTVLHALGDGYRDAYGPVIRDILTETPTAAHCDIYVRLLKDSHRYAEIIDAAARISASPSLEAAEAELSAAAALLSKRQDVREVSFAQGLMAFLNDMGNDVQPDYLDWGIAQLNKYLLCERGDFVVIGARPSVGKTVLALQLGYHLAKTGKKVGMFSLETKDKKLYNRLIAHAGRLDFEKIRRHTVSRSELDSLMPLVRQAQDIRLHVENAAGMTVSDIRAITASRGFDVIFVDYLQLVRSADSRRGNRQEEVADISMALHTMAQELGVTVVALSQFSRPPKAEKNKRPTLSDLRESGQLEQDADIVLLMSRENEANKDGARHLEIAKNKDGGLGWVLLNFDPVHMDFYTGSRPTKAGPDPEPPRFEELPEGEQEALPFD